MLKVLDENKANCLLVFLFVLCPLVPRFLPCCSQTQWAFVEKQWVISAMEYAPENLAITYGIQFKFGSFYDQWEGQWNNQIKNQNQS